jgi:hypothetical protein
VGYGIDFVNNFFKVVHVWMAVCRLM